MCFIRQIHKILNRISNTAVQCSTHSVRNLCIILFHSLANPVKHDTDKAIFIKIGNKTFFLLGNVKSFGFFLHDTHKQIVCQHKQIIFNLLPAQCPVRIHDKRLIFKNRFKYLL